MAGADMGHAELCMGKAMQDYHNVGPLIRTSERESRLEKFFFKPSVNPPLQCGVLVTKNT